MTKTIPPAARLPLAGSLLLLVCIPGCAQNSADLRLTCLENGKQTFAQHFDDAYLTKGAEGDTEIVLAGETSGTVADLRQVMHVKVLWRPQRGAKQSHPSYTNAAIHWYVFDDKAAVGQADVLEYSGAGFVRLSDTAGGTQVTIRNATLKPAAATCGTLSDPVGPANLTGTFVAKGSKQRVDALLAEVKTASQTAQAARAEQASAR